jgi:hypothetical protein
MKINNTPIVPLASNFQGFPDADAGGRDRRGAAGVARGAHPDAAGGGGAGGVCGGARAGGGGVPNRLGVEFREGLAAEQMADQQAFADEVNGRTDKENDRRYDRLADAQKGKILNVDTARELFAKYHADPRSMTKATHAVAEAYIADRLRRELAKPAGPNDVVLFTAGGMGSGKSTFAENAARNPAFALVVDSTMRDRKKALAQVRAVLRSGRRVAVNFIDVETGEAMRRSEIRARKKGRRVTPESLGSAHYKVRKNLLTFWNAFGENPRVAFAITDNNGGPADAFQVEDVVAHLRNLRKNPSHEEAHIQKARANAQRQDAETSGGRGNADGPQGNEGDR